MNCESEMQWFPIPCPEVYIIYDYVGYRGEPTLNSCNVTIALQRAE